jgi:hypothetical protein
VVVAGYVAGDFVVVVLVLLCWGWCSRVVGTVAVAAVDTVYAVAAVDVAVEVLLSWGCCVRIAGTVVGAAVVAGRVAGHFAVVV